MKLATPTRTLLVAIAAVLALAAAARYLYRQSQISELTREITTKHFVISYRGIPGGEAQNVADELERSRTRVLGSLAVGTHPIVTAHLHPTQRDFEAATGWKGASGTSAGPRTIHLSWPRANARTAIHEFAHTAQLTRLIEFSIRAGWNEQEFERRFAETYPRWLWEGVSTYLAGESSKLGVLFLMRSGRRPALSSFTRQNNDIYLVGYTIPEYVIHRWGETKLAALVGSFGDVEVALGLGLAEFERGWHEFVAAQYWTF